MTLTKAHLMPNPTPGLLTFEAMRTHYSSGDGYVYRGKMYVVTCYVNGDATPKERKAAGVGHLKAGRVYLQPGSGRPANVRKIARKMQHYWDTQYLLPVFLCEHNKDSREMLSLSVVVS